MLQIQLNEIPAEGLHLDVINDSWFPNQDLVKQGDTRVLLDLERIGDRVLVSGSIEVALVFTCDRCLEKFVSPQEINFQLVLEVAAQEEGDLAESQDVEYMFDPGQMEVLTFDGKNIDVGDLLYQQMILAVPQKNLCRLDCLGICEHCGINRNLELCGCSEQLNASPFGALKQLLKNNK